MNNLFDYATSELSQDAVICWCLNWLNEPASNLYPLAVDLLKKMGEVTVESGQTLQTIQQFYKTDILICLTGKNRVILVEDKTDSSEHGEQIRRYRERMTQLSEEERRLCGIHENVELRTVYFKTGFLYDADRLVDADVTITGEAFLQCLTPYQGKSEILDAYLTFLERKLEQQAREKDFLQEPERLNNSAIAQHTLMRMIFPETLWKRSGNEAVFFMRSTMAQVLAGPGRKWSLRSICFPLKKTDIVFSGGWIVIRTGPIFHFGFMIRTIRKMRRKSRRMWRRIGSTVRRSRQSVHTNLNRTACGRGKMFGAATRKITTKRLF